MAALANVLAIAACAPTSEAPPTPVIIGVTHSGDNCVIRIEDRTYSQHDLDAIETHFRRLKDHGRLVRLADQLGDTPWRCVGGVIFTGQRVGLTIGFTAEPPPAAVRSED